MRGLKISLGAIAFAAILGGGAYVFLRGQQGLVSSPAGAAANPAAFAMPVPVAPVVKKTIPIYLEYAARTEAVQHVNLQSKLSGYLAEQTAPDGADVREGDLLYRIDPRDFESALDQAKAQVERDAASLDYLRSNLSRGNELARSGYLAKDTFDQRASAVKQAEAALAMSKAALRTAELNVGYAEIRAPFSGRLGRNQAANGALIGAGGAPLNTLVQLAPIYVSFNPSESDLTEIQQARALGPIEADVFLPGETQPRHRGPLTFIDNTVERRTGTIVARVTIDNADRSLLPGQFVRVRLLIRQQHNALLAPQTALGSSQLGKYVYVVGDGGKADQRLVSTGPVVGDQVVLLSGVAEHDQIIDGNLQKIGPGSLVQPLPKTGS